MSAVFGPCPACARHVRVDEARCPFCSASLEGHRFALVPDTHERLPRLAVALFATTLALRPSGDALAQRPPQPTALAPTPTDLGPASAATLYGLPPGGGALNPGALAPPNAGGQAYGGPPFRGPSFDPGRGDERLPRGLVQLREVRLGASVARGARYRNELQRRAPVVRAHYERALRADPTLRGPVVVTLELEASGAVRAVSFETRLLPATSLATLERVFRMVRLPAPGRPATLRARFECSLQQ